MLIRTKFRSEPERWDRGTREWPENMWHSGVWYFKVSDRLICLLAFNQNFREHSILSSLPVYVMRLKIVGGYRRPPDRREFLEVWYSVTSSRQQLSGLSGPGPDFHQCRSSSHHFYHSSIIFAHTHLSSFPGNFVTWRPLIWRCSFFFEFLYL